MFKSFKFIIPFLVLILFLGSCTKSSNPAPSDADGFYGRSTRDYFNTNTSNTGTVIEITTQKAGLTTLGVSQSPPVAYSAQLIAIANGKVTSTVPIDPSLLQFSTDGSIVVVKGQPGIYEFSPTIIASVTSGTSTLPPATIDTFCTGIASTGYSEFEVSLQNSNFVFLALSDSSADSIGGTGTITKIVSGTVISYQKEGFGTLQVNVQSPSPSDSHFFQSAFASSPSPWASVSGMLCHLNSVPLGSSVTSPLISSTAVQAQSIPYGTESDSWSGFSNALSIDGTFATSSITVPADRTDYLKLTGYFYQSAQQVPVTATVTGVSVKCFWEGRSIDTNPLESLKLVVGGNAAGNDLANFEALPNPMGFSSTFGASNNNWGNTLTPALVNGSDFGIQLAVGMGGDEMGDEGYASVDYCTLAVYFSP